MFPTTNKAKKTAIALGLISALLLAGCSSSNDSSNTITSDAELNATEITNDTTITDDAEATNGTTITDAADGGAAEPQFEDDAEVNATETTNDITIMDEAQTSATETPIEDAVVITGPILNAGNALDIWKNTVSVINEEQINQFMLTLTNDLNLQFNGIFLENSVDAIAFSEAIVFDPAYQYESAFESNEFVSVTEGERYTCVGSGNAQTVTFPGGRDTVFNDCAVSDITYSGTTGIRNQFRAAIASQPYYELSRVASNGETTTLSGNSYGGNKSFVAIDRVDGWNDLNFHQLGTEAEFRLEDFTIRRSTLDTESNLSDSIFGASFVDGTFMQFKRYRIEDKIEGQFTVFAPWAGTEMGLTVSVDLSFADDVLIGLENPEVDFPNKDPIKPFHWETGNVTITADDGSSLIVTPSETQTGSFKLQLSNGDVIGPLSWQDDYLIERVSY